MSVSGNNYFFLTGPLNRVFHNLPVICVNSRTVEEGCKEASVPTNGVQGERYPIHRSEQEDQKGKYKCLMI